MLPNNMLSTIAVPAAFVDSPHKASAPLTDYERGGIALGDASPSLRYQLWTLTVLANGDFQLASEHGASSVLFNRPNVIRAGVAFDQNMRPAVCFEQTDGSAWLWWFDTQVGQQVFTQLPAGTNHCCIALDYRFNDATSDVILAYNTASGALAYRQQRDRFQTERVLKGNAGGKLAAIGMNTKWRLQFRLIPNAEQRSWLTTMQADNPLVYGYSSLADGWVWGGSVERNPGSNPGTVSTVADNSVAGLDSYLSIANGGLTVGLPSLTVGLGAFECWANFADSSQGGLCQFWDTINQNVDRLLSPLSAGGVYVRVWNGSERIVQSTPSVLGQLHHFVWKLEGTLASCTLSLWIDGQKKGQIECNNPSQYNNLVLGIGRIRDTTSTGMRMYGAAYYSALTDDQIADHYSAGIPA